jgi:hypothetical protein
MPLNLSSIIGIRDLHDVKKVLQALQKQIDQLKTARTLSYATVDRGGLRSANFDGDLAHNVIGTAGWGLSGTTGTIIANALLLRSGSVAASALAAPISPGQAHNDAATFAVTTTLTPAATVTIPVPAGYTRMMLMASTTATAVNSTAVTDQFGVDVRANGSSVAGYTVAQDARAGELVAVSRGMSASMLTGLSTVTPVTVDVMVRSYLAGWAASAWNTAQVDALGLFLA